MNIIVFVSFIQIKKIYTFDKKNQMKNEECRDVFYLFMVENTKSWLSECLGNSEWGTLYTTFLYYFFMAWLQIM